MSAKIIDGKKIAENIRKEVRREIVENHLSPGLAIILVGNDPASHLYVKLKEKACHQVGIEIHKYLLEEEATQEELFELIDYLNQDESISGILLQLPLPKHLDEDLAVSRISKLKDVDGFGPQNLNDFMNDRAQIIPGLAYGIYKLIKSTNEPIYGKNVAVIANSEVFAKPIVKMMKNKGAQAVYLTPQDSSFEGKVKQADIIIIAIGQKYFLKKDMIKPGVIIIDVGTNNEGGEVFGDVDPEVDELASFRSPVPGGVGPMTIAMLLYNTVELYKLQKGK